MSKIFIYYSLSGNGDAVADNLKEKGFDVRKVEPARIPPKKFFFPDPAMRLQRGAAILRTAERV